MRLRGGKDEESGQAVIEAGVREEDKLTPRKNGMLFHFRSAATCDLQELWESISNTI